MKSSKKKLTKEQQWFVDKLDKSLNEVFDDWWEKQKKLYNIEKLRNKL
jgi:hypothetical protein